MPIINNLPQMEAAIVNKESLEKLGFVNVPEGTYIFEATSLGNTTPSTDKSTIIPLTGHIWQTIAQGNTTGNLTANCSVSVNSKVAITGTGKKTGSSYTGGMRTMIQCQSIFYPFFYNMDLSATMAGISVTNTSPDGNNSAASICGSLYSWLRKVS